MNRTERQMMYLADTRGEHGLRMSEAQTPAEVQAVLSLESRGYLMTVDHTSIDVYLRITDAGRRYVALQEYVNERVQDFDDHAWDLINRGER